MNLSFRTVWWAVCRLVFCLITEAISHVKWNSSACVSSGVSVHWLGDFVFVESSLGVRLKFDMENTVYLTVTAEHQTATRGLCGVFNNNPDGTNVWEKHPSYITHTAQSMFDLPKRGKNMYSYPQSSALLCCICCFIPFFSRNFLWCFLLYFTDDFTASAGSVSQYAASFGNSWRVQDQQSQVPVCSVPLIVCLKYNQAVWLLKSILGNMISSLSRRCVMMPLSWVTAVMSPLTFLSVVTQKLFVIGWKNLRSHTVISRSTKITLIELYKWCWTV